MATKAPFGTDLQPDHDVKLRGGKLVHITREKQSLRVRSGDTAATRVHRRIRHGLPKDLLPVVTEEVVLDHSLGNDKQLLYWPEASLRRENLQSELRLPSSSDTADKSIHHQLQKNQKKLQEDGLVTAARKQKSKEFSSVLEPAMSLVRNKQRVLEDIFESCKRLDYQSLGVLDKTSTLRAFRSFGIKINEPDFTKLVNVSDCAVGGEHILYDKFCRILLGAFSGERFSLDEVLKKAEAIQTPCASIESNSPASVEEFELSIGLSFPKTPLADKTNQLLQKEREIKSKRLGNNDKSFRIAQTQPVRKGLKLPPLLSNKLSYTSPLVSRREGGKQVWSSLQKPESHNGMERLQNALLSCSDSKGQIECEQAHRTIRNYSLIYSLKLPLEEAWENIRTNASRSHKGGYCTSVQSLLKYLASTVD